MMTIAQCLASSAERLAPVSPSAVLDAELLLMFVLNQPRSFLYAYPEKTLTSEQLQLFENYLQRRINVEPIAYITGHKEFWSLDFLVTPATLIPRPETELMIETVLSLPLSSASPVKAADLGTGSGAIALALASERPAWRIFAVDVSEPALQVAEHNARRLHITNVSFHEGDWCAALPEKGLDLIISNPPYVSEVEWRDYVAGLRYEPRSALVSGDDGLSAIRQIAESSIMSLREGGYLVIEHGFLQAEAVRAIFDINGYSEIHSVRDLSSHERVTLGRLLNK